MKETEKQEFSKINNWTGSRKETWENSDQGEMQSKIWYEEVFDHSGAYLISLEELLPEATFNYGQNARVCFSSKSSVLTTSYITYASWTVLQGKEEEQFKLLLLFGKSGLLTTSKSRRKVKIYMEDFQCLWAYFSELKN